MLNSNKRHFSEREKQLNSFILSLPLFNVDKTIVTSTNLHRQKNDINNNNNNDNKKVNWLCMFFYMNPNPPMYVLRTQNEHLGSFRSLIFCLSYFLLFSQVVVDIILALRML